MIQFTFIAMSVFITSSFAFAAFEENSRRYLSNHEIAESLQTILPNPNCSMQSLWQEKAGLGVNSPLTGSPVSPAPNQGTIALITKCMADAVDLMPSYVQASKSLLGAENHHKIFLAGLDTLWKDLPEELQKNIITHMVYMVLGSDEVISDFNIIAPDLLRERFFLFLKNQPHYTNRQALKAIAVNLVLRDEFLSY